MLRMNQNAPMSSNSNDHLANGGPLATHECHGSWVPQQQYTYSANSTPILHLQNLSNVGQILPPHLTCLNQSGNGLGVQCNPNQQHSDHHPSTSLGSLHHLGSGSVIPSGSSDGGHIHIINSGQSFCGEDIHQRDAKDSLTALAEAAELNQSSLSHMMHHQTEYFETSADKKPSEPLCSITDKDLEPQVFNSCSYQVKSSSSGQSFVPAPFLSESDPDAEFYSEIYHYLCSGFYPQDSSGVYKKVLQKRARNYSISSDGTLIYGLKSPKNVVTKLDEQRRILDTSHVDKTTGSHLTARKMYNRVFAKHYWRSLYVDIDSYVKSCVHCSQNQSDLTDESQSDLTDHSHGHPGHGGIQRVPENGSVVSPKSSQENGQAEKVWKKVSVRVFGPFPKTTRGHEFVMAMTDHVSGFGVAQPAFEDDLNFTLANFILDTFCLFGFAQCEVETASDEVFEEVKCFYEEKLGALLSLGSSFGASPQDLCWSPTHSGGTLRQSGSKIEEFCHSHPQDWDVGLSGFMLGLRVNPWPQGGSSTPFFRMFGRNALGAVSEEERENVDLGDAGTLCPPTSTRRRLKSSTLECRHCHEIFTSKISFRIHQRKHTEEARRSGTMEGQRRLGVPSPVRRRVTSRGRRRKASFEQVAHRLFLKAGGVGGRCCSSSSSEKQSSDTIPTATRQHLTNTTVEAVRSLLQATKEERTKRGKYFKYSQDTKEEIAQFALDHNIPAATSYWSARLGHTVSESSVRNFIRSFKCFSGKTREEIGKMAFQDGVEVALTHCRKNLGVDICRATVVKLKKVYVRKVKDDHSNTSDTVNASSSSTPIKRDENRPAAASTRQKRCFSRQIKAEIGKYASIHGISSTIEHFSNRLQFELKDSTVRKFKRLYLERNSSSTSTSTSTVHVVPSNDTQNNVVVEEHQIPLPSQLDHPPTSVTSQSSYSYHHHQYTLSMGGVPAGGGGGGSLSMNPNSFTFHQTSLVNQGLTPLAYQQGGGATVIMNQSFPSGPPTSFQTNFANGFASPPGVNGGLISSQNGGAVSITHASVLPSLPLSNASLQLSMGGGGSHLGQLNSVSGPQMHFINANPAQPSHSSSQQLQSPHNHHLVPPSNFHHNLSGTISFEALAPQIATQNLPISLLKGPQQGLLRGVEETQQNADASTETHVSPPNSAREGPPPPAVTAGPTGGSTSAVVIQTPHLDIQQQSVHDSSQQQQQQQMPVHQMEQMGQMQTRAPTHCRGQSMPVEEKEDPDSIQQTGQVEDQIVEERDNNNDNKDQPDGERMDDEFDEEEDDFYDLPPPPTPKKKRRKRKSRRSKSRNGTTETTTTLYNNNGKRGNYVTYSPELRAQIGKYAVENGNMAAISFFKEKFKIDIPESTIRGLKDKYIVKRMKGETDVDSLGFAQRGRPMRLGKYDPIVQECIRELVKGGEKVSSFLVIATAKQVLMQYEPYLLQENGGHIQLNPTWAKSFLKRIGLNSSN